MCIIGTDLLGLANLSPPSSSKDKKTPPDEAEEEEETSKEDDGSPGAKIRWTSPIRYVAPKLY